MAEQCINSTYSFPVKKDRFHCVTVDTKKISFASDDEFEQILKESITFWKQDGVRGVWIKIAIDHASLVPICVKNGFVFHHAKASYLMCKMWLSNQDSDNLPEFANQYLGAGGFVVNDRNQVLVIKERFSPNPHWKLPGGHADLGEDIGEAAAREVLEETGIKAEFQAVLCFRHQHQFRWGCSDFYFICLMKPITRDIERCQNEIAEAQWMDVLEYMNHPNTTSANKHFAQCYLEMKSNQSSIQAKPVISYDGKRFTKVYSIWNSENLHVPNV